MFKRFIEDVKKYMVYSLVSAKSQLKSEVANSYLNWLWWILDPVCFMLIYTFIFGYVFRASEQYFPIFIFIGLSMWDFFNRMVNNSIKIVKKNKAIVTKVYIPKYILLLIMVWVNSFKMLISFSIVVLMMFACKVPLSMNILYAFPIIMLLILFSFGCGCHLLHYGVFVEDLSNVVSIGLRLLFYLTGIFYKISARIPVPYGEMLEKFNPVAFMLDSMRNVLLYAKAPHGMMLILWFLIAFFIAWTGIRKIYKNENSYVKVI